MHTVKSEIQGWMRPIKTPTLIQMEMTECGAAALGIVLGYYGRHVPLATLRYFCGVSRNGVNAYNMVEAAKYYGLEADGYEVDFDGIKQLSKPAILHWNHNHFVVLESLDSEMAYINDPATGPRSVPLKEFKECFSGVALELKPSQSFVKIGKNESLFGKIWERVVPFKDAISFLFLSQLCQTLLALAIPMFTQVFLDKFIGEQLLSWRWGFLTLLGLLAVVVSVVTWVQGKFLNFLQVRLAIQYSSKYLWHVLRLPVLFFMQRHGNEIIYRNGLNIRISEMLTGNVAVSGISLIFMGIYLLIMFQYDVLISMVGLASAIISMVMLLMMARMRRNAYARMQQEQAKTVGVSYDSINHLETMKMSSNEEYFFSRISGYYTKNINALQGIKVKDVWMMTLASLFQQLSNAVLLALGCWRVMHGSLTIGMLIAFQILLRNFLKPFSQIIQFASEIQTFNVDLNRVDDVLNNEIDPMVLKESPTDQPSIQGNIELKDVSFGYAPLDEPVLKKISLKVNQGESLAIIGKVGSGKSTIAKLIAGLYAPWEGSILYDGIAISKRDRKEISQSIGYVDQQIVLFSGTIKDNITLWNHEITDDAIASAFRDAEIENLIQKLPLKERTELIENGRNFSEGERQRLEIARALVNRPRVLILDEATSALDVENEKAVLANIRGRKCTAILITHRIGTVAACDNILLLDQGKVVAYGNHNTLVESSEMYRKMLKNEEGL